MRKTEGKIKIRNYHSDNHNHVNYARYLKFLEEGSWDFPEKNRNVGKLMKTLAEDATATILDSCIKVFQALSILIEAPKKMTLETKSQTSTQ